MSSFFTITFIGVYLPLVMLAHTLAPQKARGMVLLIASYLFVYLRSGWSLVYLIETTLVTYGFARGMGHQFAQRDELLATSTQPKREIKQRFRKRARILLQVGIVWNLWLLIALNYLEFFADVALSILEFFGIEMSVTVPMSHPPVGISFYTLMALSYLFDVYREMIPSDKNLGRVALYLCFFPHILEGPFARYNQTAHAIWNGNRIRVDSIYPALLRMAIGYYKKIVIADRLNLYVATVFADYASFDGPILAIGAVLFTIQLYCDFAGCMDIALGVAMLFGAEYPENFRHPFASQTTSEFWQRWHITLGQWFKDYVYYPVSLSKPLKRLTTKARKRWGNRYGPILASGVALFCVWFCNGLWHGAGSQYLFFGMYYFVIIWLGGFIEPAAHAWALKHNIKRSRMPYRAFRVARTLVIVFIGELFFRAPSFSAGLAMFHTILTNHSLEYITSGQIFDVLLNRADFVVALGAFVFVLLADHACDQGKNPSTYLCAQSTVVRWGLWILLIMFNVIFGAYGFGYVTVDPMYAQF